MSKAFLPLWYIWLGYLISQLQDILAQLGARRMSWLDMIASPRYATFVLLFLITAGVIFYTLWVEMKSVNAEREQSKNIASIQTEIKGLRKDLRRLLRIRRKEG